MEFFKHNTKIDFMGLRKLTGLISIVLCVGSIIALFANGLNLGLDFTGGTQIELRYPQAADLEKIRGELSNIGYPEAKVQNYGSAQEVLVHLQVLEGSNEKEVANKVRDHLKQQDPDVELMRVEFVGSEVGQHLLEQGGLAILIALLATMLYISFRFEYRFAVSSAVALLHDPILILGIFAFFHIEFDLPTLAAMLAVLGYSLNDTIVVFDRVRENFRNLRKSEPVDVMNISINQTLSRTIMTSGLTLLVVIALLIYGGESLFGFSLALFIGIVIGTYSSIYVAGTIAIAMGLSRQDLLPAAKPEGDGMP